MKTAKKTIGLILALIAMSTIATAFAVLYITKTLPIQAGVTVNGNISILKQDGTTEVTTLAFGYWNTTSETAKIYFQVKNIGNVPVTVRITASNGGWVYTPASYAYLKTGDPFAFGVYDVVLFGDPVSSLLAFSDTQTKTIAVGASDVFCIQMACNSVANVVNISPVNLVITASDA